MNILEHAKEIAELVKKYKDQDLYEKIVKLREEILELREENLSYREELKKTKAAMEVASLLKREGNCYFLHDDLENKHPYCLTCWDADRKLVSLIVGSNHWGTTVKCGICTARVGKES